MLRSIQALTLLGAVAFGLQPDPAAAVDFSKVSLRPLLQVESTRLTEEDPIAVGGILFGGRLRSDISLTVSRGGAVLVESAGQSFELAPFQAQYVRGIASSRSLAPLSSALNAARVGLQTDCSLEEDRVLTGRDQITWYGAGARRNSFRIGYGAEAAGLPTCPSGVRQLLQAIGALQDEVRNDPESEVLTSR